MRLLLVRHAEAIDRTAGMRDEDRTLTPDGAKKFRLTAKGLARLVEPDVVLTSPLPRARQTAEIAAEAWGGPRPEDAAALASGSWSGFTALLEGRSGDATVALFGHEPTLSEWLARLLGSDRSAALAFKKGGAALVEVAGTLEGGSQLVWFLPPKVLRELA